MKNAIAFGLGALTVVTLTWVATVGVQAQEQVEVNTVTSVSETTSSTTSSTSSTSSSTTSTTISQQVTAVDEDTGTTINLIDGCNQVHPFPDYTGMTIAQLSSAGPRDFWGCGPITRSFWSYNQNGDRIVGSMPCVDRSEPTVQSQVPLPNTQISLAELTASGTEITWTCS